MIQIIEQLEAHQGWETSCVVAAKSFAAWQFRNVHSLPLPDDRLAQMHVDFQRDSFGRYQRSIFAERDRESGSEQQLLDIERVLV